MILKGRSFLSISIIGVLISTSIIDAFVANTPIKCSSTAFNLPCKTTSTTNRISHNRHLPSFISLIQSSAIDDDEVSTVTDDEISSSASIATPDVELTSEENAPEQNQNHTAYIVNLSYNTTNKDLYDVCGEYGKVERVYIPNDRNTNQPKGIAFVTMSTNKELKKIIEVFTSTPIDGRTVYIDKAKPRGVTKEKEMVTKLYIGNLSFDNTEKEIEEYFSYWGEVKLCYAPIDRETGKLRGFAFVTMDSKAAEMAINEGDGAYFGGREIQVSLSLTRGERPNKVRTRKFVKLYVGNIAYETDLDILREAFEYVAPVKDIYMPVHSEPGTHRGYGFVTVQEDLVDQYFTELDGYELDGRQLRVSKTFDKGSSTDNDDSNADDGDNDDSNADDGDNESGDGWYDDANTTDEE